MKQIDPKLIGGVHVNPVSHLYVRFASMGLQHQYPAIAEIVSIFKVV